MNNSIIKDFTIRTTASITAGIILAFIFFIFKEKIYPLPDINGRYHLIRTTQNSTSNKYIDMQLTYEMLLRSEGNKIYGTAEKIKEVNKKETINYIGKNRGHIVVNGYIEKNYLSDDRVVLLLQDDGKTRKFSHYYSLEVNEKTIRNKETINGDFFSSVANQSGVVSLYKLEK